MFLEQIERKLRKLMEEKHPFRLLRQQAQEDFGALCAQAKSSGVGAWKTMGIKFPENLRHRLDQIQKKYELKSRKDAVYLALNAGIRVLLDPEDFKS